MSFDKRSEACCSSASRSRLPKARVHRSCRGLFHFRSLELQAMHLWYQPCIASTLKYRRLAYPSASGNPQSRFIHIRSKTACRVVWSLLYGQGESDRLWKADTPPVSVFFYHYCFRGLPYHCPCPAQLAGSYTIWNLKEKSGPLQLADVQYAEQYTVSASDVLGQ